MPKRTNLFQQLAQSVYEQLSIGSHVEESAMLKDEYTGSFREVDIVVRTSVSTHDNYMSIECRDHSRRQDVTWVESMYGKHTGLPTNKLVLWSRSGFSKDAIVKANALNIDTISGDEGINTDWAKIARDIEGGYVHYLAPTFLTPVIDVMLPDNTLFRIEDASTVNWENADGKNVGSMQVLITNIQYHPDLATVFLDHAPIGSGEFHIEVKPDEPWFTMTADGKKASIQRILIGVSTVKEQASSETASINFDGRIMTLNSANFSAGKLESFIIESPVGSPVVRTQYISKLT